MMERIRKERNYIYINMYLIYTIFVLEANFYIIIIILFYFLANRQ